MVTAFPDVVRQMDADDENEIIKLAACTDAKVVRTVMESGFDLARTGAGGSTDLHIAAWQGHLQPVRTLLDFHAPVNARCDIRKFSTDLGSTRIEVLPKCGRRLFRRCPGCLRCGRNMD